MPSSFLYDLCRTFFLPISVSLRLCSEAEKNLYPLHYPALKGQQSNYFLHQNAAWAEVKKPA